MKNLKYVLILTLLMGFLSSCEDYFGDINKNPNSPSTVPSATLLPSIQTILTYGVWGDLSRYNAIFTQQVKGVDRQFAAYQDYIIRGNDMDNLWQSILYSNVLTDIGALRSVSGDPAENGVYHGIANVLEAYTFLVLTDHFGDIPFTQSVNKLNDGNLQPGFDTQEKVYTDCIKLLTDALVLFDGKSIKKPNADDFFYKGDVTKWKKFANAVLARAYLHLSKRDASNFDKALAAARASFTSHADNPEFAWEATRGNPWNQFNDQRQGSFSVGTAYLDIMGNLEDPRIAKFGATLDKSHPILTATAPSPLISYTEIAFIIAEISFRQNAADANSAYENAIKSSFDKHVVEGFADYFAKTEVNALTLENIIKQKYIALFLDPETFSDWRRTGFPVLTPNTGSEIPRRYPYPQTETDYNRNCPKPDVVGLFNRVWWDVN